MCSKPITDYEKMHFDLASMASEDGITTKDKIRYTERYLHNVRTGGSQYSQEKEKYLENRLSELREDEKRETRSSQSPRQNDSIYRGTRADAYKNSKSASSAGNETILTNTEKSSNIKNVQSGRKYVEDNDYKAYLEGKLSEDDLMTIAEAKALYNVGGYYFKNVAHKLAAELRSKYDPKYIEHDTFDFTHGGKYIENRGAVPAIPVYEKPKPEDIFNEALKDDKAETLVVIAAGINTHDALNKDEGIFYELKNELQARYGDNARIMVTYPLGESDNALMSTVQGVVVGGHMLDNGGGKEIADVVSKNRGNAEKVVLIGHSGGGQAVGDALEELNKRGIPVHHALQFGAPKDKVKREYVDKTTRIEWKEDIVPNLVTIDNVTGLATLISPKTGGALIAGQALASDQYAYPETIELDYEDWNLLGGHSEYFHRGWDDKKKKNIDNISLWIDKVWDKIK